MTYKELKKVLLESIHDKYLFKCVFLAGGPGSGKSFVSEQTFGIDEIMIDPNSRSKVSKSLTGLGAMYINSDDITKRLLVNAGLTLTFDVHDPTYSKKMEIRDLAKMMTSDRAMKWINGMLPIIIDGTGKDYEKINTQRTHLTNIGYDTSMIFVNTSLDVAQTRNVERALRGDRKVDPAKVEEMWKAVQQNIGKFQQLFGGKNMLIIDNNEPLLGDELINFSNRMYKYAVKFLQAPLQNSIGVQTIQKLKYSGGLYLSDLPYEDRPKFKLV